MLVPDVETDADLKALVDPLAPSGLLRICAGSASLAELLAQRSRAPESAPPAPSRARNVAAVVGTPSAHTANQVAHAETVLSLERIPCHVGAADLDAVLVRARQAWTAGRCVLIDAVVPDPSPSPEQTEAQRDIVSDVARLLQRDVP